MVQIGLEPGLAGTRMKRNSRKINLTFLRMFLSDPVAVGAITPSSNSLAREITRNLSIDQGQAVLELGPGTGAFTSYLCPLLPEPGAYLGIEREPRFVRLLQEHFPDLKFVTGPAERLQGIGDRIGLPLGAIISSIPFVGVRNTVHDSIIEDITNLMGPGCVFRTFQYLHTYLLPSSVRFRKKMSEKLGCHQRSRLILRNLPPVYVLTWIRENRLTGC